jgi:hypothetical protein
MAKNNSVCVVLDHSALGRLLGDDPELEVAIKKAALASIARQRVKLAMADEVKEYLSKTYSFDLAIREEVGKMLAKNTNWNCPPQLSAKFTELVQQTVQTAFDKIINDKMFELHQTFEAIWHEKISECNKEITARLANYVTVNTTPEKLDALVLRAAKEQMRR